jgi:hypothetical protein
MSSSLVGFPQAMRSNWNPIVVAVASAVTISPLFYDILQPMDFDRGRNTWIPTTLFLGMISVFFVFVIASNRFARICARTEGHLPGAIRDARVAVVLLAVCWFIHLLATLLE